ncbi:MAG: hypothetical protein AUI09_03495 [Gemmatimonadetes bacterium 13_2_20CM_2_66_5]|nr:MAG: hypothetical protein AUI09_03495 [Gemmatimonadetes bacterium 13_2_20CM_2_66_5]
MSSITTLTLLEMKEKGERIVALTCYDALFARLLDASGVDILLVGDSLNQVLAGAPSTLSATLDQMIYHTKMVRRGTERAMVVCDMPFLSYQISPEDALRNCGRAMKETGCNAVKIEGGQPMAATVRRLVEEAGAFAIVLELVPAPLASQITKSLLVPTIGIGAGPACDGQVLVLHDMLGLNDQFSAKFVKKYAALAEDVREAARLFTAEVREGRYPGPEHSFGK